MNSFSAEGTPRKDWSFLLRGQFGSLAAKPSHLPKKRNGPRTRAARSFRHEINRQVTSPPTEKKSHNPPDLSCPHVLGHGREARVRSAALKAASSHPWARFP